ncbi:MAG TPA: hypothetical protein VEJ87_06175, partial [Acidimicrobiales bacterium]|nr:hypothetical protein [Acidimicrobiales bacterium]
NMTKTHLRPIVAAVVAVLAGSVAAACSQQSSSPRTSDAPADPVTLSLATSLQNAQGTWAVVPMGHLDQTLNTFWQLFFEPPGGTTWSNEVDATAVATNGGLTLASGSDGSVIVGIRPSNLLRYSPLIATTDAGGTWANGVLPYGLSAYPDSLAASSEQQAAALVEAPRGDQVLESLGTLGSWNPLVDERALAATPAGSVCGLRAITAIAYLAGTPFIGGSCDRPGEVGILARRSGSWQLTTPFLNTKGSGLGGDEFEVLALRPTGDGLSALFAGYGGGSDGKSDKGVILLGAWTSDGHKWTTSPPLQLLPQERLASFGPANGSNVFVLTSAGSSEGTGSGSVPAPERLEVLAPGENWVQLTTPPAGTATVAFSSDSKVDALAVDQSILSVWSLTPDSHDWTRAQVIRVPIQYGSSS